MTLAEQFDVLIQELKDPNYAGRYELSPETPTVQFLLNKIRDAFNRDWRQEQVDTGQIDSCHCDFIASLIPNAIAFRSGRQYFIGITLPMITRITERSSVLSRHPSILEVLNVEPSERRRTALMSVFLTSLLHFIFAHELGHLHYGHLPDSATNRCFRQEFHPGQATGSPKKQAEELLADAHGVYSVLQNFLSDQTKEYAISIGLADEVGDSLEELLLRIVFIAIGGYFLLGEPDRCHAVGAYLRTHPPALLRVSKVAGELMYWCGQKLPRYYEPSESPRMIALVSALIEALPSHREQWEAQREFLISADGEKYEDVLMNEVLKQKQLIASA